MEPLLSSLCTICHIDPPKYTCPRCSVETCSLKCSRRHKLWSSCNGVRDPTAFVPMSRLATPSGIDHDYNFLHSIEHKIERSEKEIIEDRRLLKRKELDAARLGDDALLAREKQVAGEACVNRVLQVYKIRVYRAPPGMRRNVENTTNWSRKNRTINWQVEWVREGPADRLLRKILGHKPLGPSYAAIHEEERRISMTNEELRNEKKRKAERVKERSTKKLKLERESVLNMSAIPLSQEPETTTWSVTPVPSKIEEAQSGDQEFPVSWYFYLHRPNTSSSYRKVLVPLDRSRPLLDQLRKRELMEFPTIYVRDQEAIPEDCMLEEEFLRETGQVPIDSGDDSDPSEDDSEKDDTSTSGSDSDEDAEMEDGEIR